MKHLFLHVGMHKTGTTSIQATFFANRVLLAEQGIHYFDAAWNHSALIETGFGEATLDAPLRRRALAAREQITRFLRGQPEGRFVISGEDMCRMAPDEIRSLLAFLRALVDRVSVVCFVRPPRGYITSSLQQGIRAGTPLGRLRALGPPNYRNHIAKFLDCADLADTILPLHDRAALVRGCSIATMLDICGAPPALYDRLDLKQENSSLTRDGAALLLALGSAGLPSKAKVAGRSDRIWRRHAVRIANELPGPRFAIPPPLIDAVLARPLVQADLRWAEERIGRRFPDQQAAPPADAEAAAAAWPANELTHLSRSAAEALCTLLGSEAQRLRRTPAATAFARVQGWLEGWLACSGPDQGLPRDALAELAARLLVAIRATDALRMADDDADQPEPTAERPGKSVAA